MKKGAAVTGEMVGHWIAWQRSSGAPETTVALRRYYIVRLMMDHSSLLTLTVDDLARWLGQDGWSPNTRKSARSGGAATPAGREV